MQKTLAEIAKIVEGEVVGDESILITGLNGIQEAQPGELSFLANTKYLPLTKTTKASALIVSTDQKIEGVPLIVTDNPSMAFAKVVSVFCEEESFCFEGIHPTAYVDPSAQLGKDVRIGPCSIIEPDVVIGDNTTIGGGVYIAHHTAIGNNCQIYPNAVVYHHSKIGGHVILHSGCVIGADGFGFEQVDGNHEKIPQVGIVRIEDHVEVGANSTIDRARFSETVIGEGTKIDNLVQIAHNCVIGKRCIIVAQVGISGSTVVEDESIIAGQGGVAGHVTIGKGSVVYAQAGVTGNLPPNSKVQGYPAIDHMTFKRINAHINKLPVYSQQIKDLMVRIEELEKKANDKS